MLKAGTYFADMIYCQVPDCVLLEWGKALIHGVGNMIHRF